MLLQGEIKMSQHNKGGGSPKDEAGWIDIGCDDFSRASLNRAIIKLKYFTESYVIIERLLRTNFSIRLPDQLIGSLPTVGKHRSNNYNEE